jgi:glycosyltransferase involved in cell wall biosynthesis
LEQLADGHVLVPPSLHDSGGCVCLEPMAAGRPVIRLDLGGPALEVTEETASRSPQSLRPRQLRTYRWRERNSPGDPACLGQSGRELVSRLYHWEEKGKYLADLYNYNQAISANLLGSFDRFMPTRS